MESFPLFFRIRVITFIFIMMFSFLWLVLLCVEVFTRWSVSDRISQSLMILFVLTNSITLIMLPILILVRFRVWLDAARLLLLFVLQLGSAVCGTAWNNRIQCPDQSPDDVGVCQLISIYTMIAGWIIPAILVFYSTYFAIVVYLQSRIPVVVDISAQQRGSGVDFEAGSTSAFSLWREKLKEVITPQSPSTPTSDSSTLPANARTRQLSHPHLSTLRTQQATLPDAPRRQSTMPLLPYLCEQPTPPILPPNRHHSLPALATHRRALPAFSTPPPLATGPSRHHLATPSDSSVPSSANPWSHSSSFGLGTVDAYSSGDLPGRSRHLSMMPSSPVGEMQSTEEAPATPRRARLSKPAPAHFM